MNNGFTCENLSDEKYVTLNQIHLNDNRIFNVPDNHLYHPVKSTINEISKLNNIILNLKKQNQDLLLLYRKVFLTQFIEHLIAVSSVNIRNLKIRFERNFNYLIILLTEDAGLRYELKFLNNVVHISLHFHGKYINEYYDKIKDELKKRDTLKNFKLYEQPNNGSAEIYLDITKFDDVALVVSVMKSLIENTYHILNNTNEQT